MGVHLADWRGIGNGHAGAALGEQQGSTFTTVRRSNRVGYARKARAERAATVAGSLRRPVNRDFGLFRHASQTIALNRKFPVFLSRDRQGFSKV